MDASPRPTDALAAASAPITATAVESAKVTILPDGASPAAAGRLVSVDAMRGFDMIWILGADAVVQSLAGIHRNGLTLLLAEQVDHVRWAGLRFYDLIYPVFLFLVGVSIVFSLDKALATETKGTIVGRILRRGALLYLLNFIFNGGFSSRWPDIRVASGVLAMIAACYVIAALIYCFLADRLKVVAGIAAALLLGYWALLGLTPFPDFRLETKTIDALAAKAGSRSPTAIAAQVPQRVSGVYEEGYNFSNYTDYRLLPGRLHNRYFESEGLLGPISASTICLMGVFAARLLKLPRLDPRRKALALVLGGLAAITIGLVWGIEFPLVKKLWSSSFCLVAGGYAAILLAGFYLVVDVWGFQRWCQPFIWIGMNPITLYLLSQLVSFRKIAERFAGGDVKDFFDGLLPGTGTTVFLFVALILMVLVARFLYRHRIFLRV